MNFTARNKLFFAKMPFAREEIRIATGAQTFCNGEFLQREMIFKRCWQHLTSAFATDEIRDSDAWWILAGHDAGARWRTYGTRRVTLRESHPALRYAVNVRSLVKRLRIVRADVHVAQVIGENEDNVGAAR